MSHKKIVYSHFTPPTGNPADCECGAKGDPKAARWPIPNCPCCDGIEHLKYVPCDCGDKFWDEQAEFERNRAEGR
jgi:hypothetical protein